MNGTKIPAGSVVVGVDGSDAAAQALDWACAQATLEGRTLVVAHAIPPVAGTWLDPDGREARIGLGGRRAPEVRLLDQASERVLQHDPRLDVHEVLRVTDPARLLAELGATASMVVVGSRGFGPARSVVLGSVGRTLTRHPPCTVVVHRPRRDPRSSSEVLVGVDDSLRSVPVLELAFQLADQRHLSLRLLNCVWEVPMVAPDMWGSREASASAPTPEHLPGLVAPLTDKYPQVAVDTEVVGGEAETMIGAMSEQQAMVVVGAHREGIRGMFTRSVTTSVLEHARCPVVVVPLEA